MMKLYDEEEILMDFIASERREERERFEKKRLSDLLQMIQNVMVKLATPISNGGLIVPLQGMVPVPPEAGFRRTKFTSSLLKKAL